MTTSHSQQIHFPQLQAQTLNNQAAQNIQDGEYSTAISTLIRALQVSSHTNPASDQDPPSCSCSSCSLDSCMEYSQQVAGSCDSSKGSIHSSSDKFTHGNGGYNHNTDGGYLYRDPIRVPPRVIQQNHSMGLVLPLILTFNLALAHHLQALHERALSGGKLKKILRLYELLFRWQMDDDDVQVDSIIFTLIISNNLGEIHRAVCNHDTYNQCLQHLLSTVMFMVECKGTQRSVVNIDGFLRNTSRLILHNNCAGAA